MMTPMENATVPEPLFIAQGKLEAWMEKGEVRFEDNQLTLLAEQVTYDLAPALRVMAVIDGQDAAGLVGTVRRLDEIAALGAEHYRDSLLLGNTAYQCEEGFVGVRQAVSVAPAVQGAAPAPTPVEAPKSDADLLTDFLLKHL